MEWFRDFYRQHKDGVIVVVFFVLCLLFLFIGKVDFFASDKKEPQEETNFYGEGILFEGAPWVDKNGEVHSNSKDTLVEISKGKIVMSDGSESKPFEFLEGTYAGIWGYTKENFLFVRQKKSAPNSQSRGTEKTLYANAERSCTCIVDFEDIDLVIKRVNENKDAKFYDSLVRTGRILLIKKNTPVTSYDLDSYRGFTPVIFMDGEYKGRRVYVLSKRLQ